MQKPKDEPRVTNVFLDGSTDITKKTVREAEFKMVFRVLRDIERRRKQ